MSYYDHDEYDDAAAEAQYEETSRKARRNFFEWQEANRQPFDLVSFTNFAHDDDWNEPLLDLLEMRDIDPEDDIATAEVFEEWADTLQASRETARARSIERQLTERYGS